LRESPRRSDTASEDETMQTRRIALLSIVLAAGFVSGCGGGGGDDSSNSVTPAANGSYAGTYSCANAHNDANLSAILTTATGAFSSCSGDVDKHTAQISCTGSIGADGTFNVAGIDTNGVKSTYVGVADAKTVSGTVTAILTNGSPPVSDTFNCTH
jgi:hypothetical protein